MTGELNIYLLCNGSLKTIRILNVQVICLTVICATVICLFYSLHIYCFLLQTKHLHYHILKTLTYI